MMKPKFVASLGLIVLVHSIGLSNSQDSLGAEQDVSVQEHGQLWIGLDAGMHFGSSTKDGFNQGVYLKLSLFEKPIDDWGEISIGIAYWHGSAKNAMRKSEDGKGADLQLLFRSVQTTRFSLSIGPRIGLEDVNHAQGMVANAGVVLVGTYQFADRWRVRLQSLYQTGGEVFAIGGGGYSYSFPAIAIGIATNIGTKSR
jgi:hypothetical protein